MKISKFLSFDDVLLMPQYSRVKSRKDISLKTNLEKEFKVWSDLWFSLPIISSPMDTITESTMAIAMAQNGGLGIIHRYNTIEDQMIELRKTRLNADKVGIAVGMTGDYFARVVESQKIGCPIICIDVAHGHHELMKKAIDTIKSKYPDVKVIAGNVATAAGFADLEKWGADAIRVGIGCGSICSTRLQTGHGIPLLSSIMMCEEVRKKAKIIADGGLRNSGDICKAIAAGADFIMTGRLLAGTDEVPSNKRSTVSTTIYRGMASHDARMDWKKDASSPEGISVAVPWRGSVKSVLRDIEGGIRSGLSYSGCWTIKEFQEKAVFIQISQAGKIEGDTHILL